jgi:hypothetical protein
MDNTYIALKKILNMMVPEKYPIVLSIKVIDDSYENYNNHKKYTVYLGVSYGALKDTISSDIREYVRDVSRYVLKGDESLKIMFGNTDLS